MAYNFLVESNKPIEWNRLVLRLRVIGEDVEAFPIPSHAPAQRDAIGVSLPRNNANEEGSRQLEDTLRALMREFMMEVTDLHTGQRLSIEDLPEIRASALGASAASERGR